MEKRSALADLVKYEAERRQAENNVRHSVAVARSADVSWGEIAAILGVSRQAAQQRYSDAVPNTYRCDCGWSHIIPLDRAGMERETRVVLEHIRIEHPDLGGKTAGNRAVSRTDIRRPSRPGPAPKKESTEMSNIKVGDPYRLTVSNVGDCDSEFQNGPFTAACILDKGHKGKHVASDGQKVVEVWA